MTTAEKELALAGGILGGALVIALWVPVGLWFEHRIQAKQRRRAAELAETLDRRRPLRRDGMVR